MFSSEQTYTLSHFVVSLSVPSGGVLGVGGVAGAGGELDTAEREVLMLKVQEELHSLLRVALVRNLSRALMNESSYNDH